jgi:Trk-type K+ transport system membrane component
MNRKGQVIIFALMIIVVIFILALAFIYPVNEGITNARNVTAGGGMDCSNSSISNYNKAACMVADITLPYFIIGLLAIGGAFFGAKLLWE